MGPIEALLFSILILIAGSVISALSSKDYKVAGYLSFFSVFLASLGIFYAVYLVYTQGAVVSEVLFDVPMIGSSLKFRIDALSVLFLIIICVIGTLSTLFSIDYMSIYKKEDLIRFYPFLLLFIASMICLVCVSDLFFFFFFWEFMTLTSYVLIIYEKEKKVNLRAGFKYFLMTHIATALMFIAGIILYKEANNSFDFQALKGAMNGLVVSKPILVHLILALFLIGFGTKAAVFPLGDWLPDAYTAAPSSASAIFSGVMSKMGVYGILMVFIYFMPLSHHLLIWGAIIALWGTISLFVGSVTALYQSDSKRLIAFSSIGQVGYILLSIGMGIAFLQINPVVSVIALIAGLYHLINDASFKALLFLNAGSILYKTGTRNLDKLGGLGKLMPFTAAVTIIAALSVAGIPPLCGFASKWLIFQVSILGGIDIPLYVIFGIVALFISIVTLAYALKFVGTAFLGKVPQEIKNLNISEVPATMKVSQGILAILCIVLGIVPLLPLKIIYASLAGLGLSNYAPNFTSLFGSLSIWGVMANLGEGITAVWNPLVIIFALFICFLISYCLYRLGGAPVKETTTWYSGEKHPDEEAIYRAYSFYGPFKKYFKNIYPQVSWPRLPDFSRLKKVLEIDNWLYYPIVKWSGRSLDKFSEVHSGVPQTYVLWMAVGVILGIIIMFIL